MDEVTHNSGDASRTDAALQRLRVMLGKQKENGCDRFYAAKANSGFRVIPGMACGPRCACACAVENAPKPKPLVPAMEEA